ncbi:hypothetical protein QYF68_23290 [Mycolicibacterium austroafricanum]|uniref:Uncharacterized protein n=1 Tax=Mycolicibacterium austroafricanum TaxID=39687 RepID=A0ABT8HIW9_MYCAO|nr:hypothetical protein [Mycolicibacterium austroafricanum]MDN4520717.1 hypothetical protein [Mycolicibacterium austroafricanum]
MAARTKKINQHPVDSATRACCGGIGTHTRECRALTSLLNGEVKSADIALRLDSAVNLIDLARADGNKVLQDLPRDTGLFQVVDMVAALGHLRQAAVLIDKVADALESEAVQR